MDFDTNGEFVSSVDDLIKEFSHIKESRDCISYKIFHRDFYKIASERCTPESRYSIPGRTDALRNLVKFRSSILNLVYQYSNRYVWHKDAFNLAVIVESPPSESGDTDTDTDLGYLQGCIRYGENVEDEWFLVYLLFRITHLESIPGGGGTAWAGADLVVQITDQDGELLLIEASEHLPEWLDSMEKSVNRVWLHCGSVLLVPRERLGLLSLRAAAHYVFAHLSLSGGEVGIGLLDASEITRCIDGKLSRYPGHAVASMYRCGVCVPTALARLLVTFPQSVATLLHVFIADNDLSDSSLFADGGDAGACGEVFYSKWEQLDGIELLLADCFLASGTDEDADAFVLVPITISKVLYSELVFHSEGFEFPSKYVQLKERCLARSRVQIPTSCAMRPGLEQAAVLGCKLVYACEVLWRLHEERKALRQPLTEDLWIDTYTPDASDRPDILLGGARSVGVLRCVAADELPNADEESEGQGWDGLGMGGHGCIQTHRVILTSWTDRLFQMVETQPHYSRYLVPPCSPALLAEFTLPQPAGGSVDDALLLNALLLHCDRECTHRCAASEDLVAELVAQSKLACPAVGSGDGRGAYSSMSAGAHKPAGGCHCVAIANDKWLTVSPADFDEHLAGLAKAYNLEAQREEASAAMETASAAEQKAEGQKQTNGSTSPSGATMSSQNKKKAPLVTPPSPAPAAAVSSDAPRKPYLTSRDSAGAASKATGGKAKAPPRLTGNDAAIVGRINACLAPLDVDMSKVMQCLQKSSGEPVGDTAKTQTSRSESKAGPLSGYFSDEIDGSSDDDTDSDEGGDGVGVAQAGGVSGCSVRTVPSPDRRKASSSAPNPVAVQRGLGVSLGSSSEEEEDCPDSDDGSAFDSDDYDSGDDDGEDEAYMCQYMEQMDEELFSSTLKKTFFYPSDADATAGAGAGKSAGEISARPDESSLGEVDVEYNFVRNVLEAREEMASTAAEDNTRRPGQGQTMGKGLGGAVMGAGVQDLLARMGVSLDEPTGAGGGVVGGAQR